jgi:hypothetical protein
VPAVVGPIRGHQAASGQGLEPGGELAWLGRPETVVGAGVEDWGDGVGLVADPATTRPTLGYSRRWAATTGGAAAVSTAMTWLAGGKATTW